MKVIWRKSRRWNRDVRWNKSDLFMAIVNQQVDATSFSKERTTVSSQKLNKFSSIELPSKDRTLPGESFSIQRVSKWIHSFSAEPRVPLESEPVHSTTDGLVVFNRGGIIAPEKW